VLATENAATIADTRAQISAGTRYLKGRASGLTHEEALANATDKTAFAEDYARYGQQALKDQENLSKATNYLQETGENFSKGASKMGQGIADTAKSVGKTISESASKVGQGIADTAKSVGRSVGLVKTPPPASDSEELAKLQAQLEDAQKGTAEAQATAQTEDANLALAQKGEQSAQEGMQTASDTATESEKSLQIAQNASKAAEVGGGELEDTTKVLGDAADAV